MCKQHRHRHAPADASDLQTIVTLEGRNVRDDLCAPASQSEHWCGSEHTQSDWSKATARLTLIFDVLRGGCVLSQVVRMGLSFWRTLGAHLPLKPAFKSEFNHEVQGVVVVLDEDEHVLQ